MGVLRLVIAVAWLAFALASGSTVNQDGIRSIPLRTHSLTQPYLDTDMQSRWFDFGGNTIIRADQYVRLTSDKPSQEGWIYSRVPLTATNWEIEVEFRIHGATNLHGDGLAMWLTKSRAMQGPVFGGADNFEGLGVFIDTYKNNRPGVVFPYVMAMMGDGKTSYDKQNDGKDNELLGCSARGIREPNVPSRLRLTYFQDKSLKLELSYKSEGVWETCFETDKPPAIPSVAYLGFSAETGELSDNHDIISVNTRNLYNTNPSNSDSTRNAQKPVGREGIFDGNKEPPPPTGWIWFFFKIFICLAVISGCYVAWTAWRTHQKRSNRF